MSALQLKLPLPPRRAASALRQQIVEHLVTQRPAVGSPLLSGKQLMDLSGLSPATVQRALDQLQREGWIDRRIGLGTFVGPRAAASPPPAGAADAGAARSGPVPSKSVLRLAVLIFGIGDLAHDWYTPQVLEGIDQAAEEFGISVELLGNRDRDVDAISRRLVSSRPDVLACLAVEAKHAFVIRDAQKLGIPCLVTGTAHLDLELPTIREDNAQGTRLAVQHLVAHGHRRIGLVFQPHPGRWVFERRDAWHDALEEAGVDPDEGLVHWLPAHRGFAAELDALRQYLKRQRPTAVIAGHFRPVEHLGRLVRGGELRIPGELSLVTFDQASACAEWLGDRRPDTIALPLREMGRRLAEMARRAAEREPLPPATYLPCRLVPGETVGAAPPAPAAAAAAGAADRDDDD